jgi:hypothetical protein
LNAGPANPKLASELVFVDREERPNQEPNLMVPQVRRAATRYIRVPQSVGGQIPVAAGRVGFSAASGRQPGTGRLLNHFDRRMPVAAVPS